MRKLSSLILAMAFSVSLFSQSSPHGEDFKISCTDCHNTEGWKVDLITLSFNHNTTKFKLVGQHQAVNCRMCHKSLIFSIQDKECISCHTDMHNQTVGPECARCHTPNSWIVNNITEIHQRSRFPLVGPHRTADCYACHKNASASLLNFGPLGVECIDCHQANYASTANPNHAQAGYSTNCTECHTMNSFTWGSNVDHSFFPLKLGHAIDCKQCHTSGTFSKLPTDCISCHQTNYNASNNPNHAVLQLSTNCTDCHTTNPGWKPTSLNHGSFPLTLGHSSLDCSKCHNGNVATTPTQCISCHQPTYNATTNPNHIALQIPAACEQCHTTNPGWKPATFDHGTFPLTLGHSNVDCEKCHNGNYTNIPTQCISCHQPTYNATTNPNHILLQFPTACEQCHTTNPDWKPATVDHGTFPLTLGHSNVECNTCHNGNYTNTSKECISCHLANYNTTTNPNHVSLNFSTTCTDCHNTNPGWKPAQFTLHDTYFPIYSGKHNSPVWNQCTDCHTNTANYGVYTCIDCHPHNNKTETDNNHNGVGGYAYNSPACYACHPTGNAGGFNHNNVFPLTGAHTTTPCSNCHISGYQNTPTVCSECHTTAYNQSTNPNHVAINIPNTCSTCHTTNPGWQPATFPIHGNYYPLTGAHANIANNCVTCHQGNYVNSPNTCVGCHLANYNQTTNPNHVTSQFPTTCETCHSTTGWSPATFNHNNVYPLTGAHLAIANDCNACHQGNYVNPPNTCAGCHQANYNQTTNPNHGAIAIPTTCATCHTTNPNWKPATFPIHNNYYVLAGAHVAIANNCVVCHNGNYNSTPNTCVGCHLNDYNTTTDPPHAASQFPTTCLDCHTQNAWIPANWNHDGLYFPIYSGKHKNKWNNCTDCHTNPGNYAVFSCITSCHPQSSTNNDHQGVAGYSYNSDACYSCHPNGTTPKMMLDRNINKN